MKGKKINIKNIKKIEIKKKRRIILYGICTLILLVSSILQVLNYTSKQYEEERIPLYSYDEKAQIDYQVRLKPNELFEEDTLGPDKLYIANYIDHINLHFNYDFNGEGNIKLNGQYEIGALLEAAIEKDKEEIILWKKDYMYKENTFNNDKNNLEIKEDIPLFIDGYKNFVKKVVEESGISPNINLKIYFNVKTNGKNEYGTIEEKRSPYINIPIGGNYFEISGKKLDENKGAIEKVNQILVPPNKTKSIVYGIIIIIAVFSLIFIKYYTINRAIVKPIEEYVKKILRKHENRVVILENKIHINNERIIKLNKFENIIKVCDELEKPILYEKNYYNHSFYVLNKEEIYIYELEGDKEEEVVLI